MSTQTFPSSTATYNAELGDGIWYWKVQASNGVLTSTSATYDFRVCALVPPSAFSVKLPADNTQGVDYSNITFSWGLSTLQVGVRLLNVAFKLYDHLIFLSFFFFPFPNQGNVWLHWNQLHHGLWIFRN